MSSRSAEESNSDVDIAGRIRTLSPLRMACDHPVVSLCVVVLTGIRVLLACWTPLISSIGSTYDDGLLLQYAYNIVQGNWLGSYNNLTLAKNPGYGLFVAACYVLHVPYQFAYIALYVVACAVCCLAIRAFVPSRTIRAILFTVLLYAPAFFTLDYFQRMYRMGIVLPLTMLIFASYIGLYLRSDKPLRSVLPWAICAGLSLLGLWASTESAMWVVPFVAVCSLVVLGERIAIRRKSQKAWSWLCGWAVVLVLPIALLVAGNSAIRATNNATYGVSMLNDRYQGGFSRATAAMMGIEAGERPEFVWLSNAALEKAIEVSPTLRSQQDPIKKNWDAARMKMSLKELTGDLSYWNLRQGYTNAGGYVDARETDAFWNAVADELEEAYSDGRLTKRKGLYVSSTTDPIPWNGIPAQMFKTIKQIAKFCLHKPMTQQIIASSKDPAAGTGTLEDQQRALELVGGNALMGGEPQKKTTEADQKNDVLNPEVLSAGALALDVDHYIGAIGSRVGMLLACGLVVALPYVLYLLFVKQGADRWKFVLVLAALLLSGFLLVFSVTWSTNYVWAASHRIHDWATFSYCAPFYALLMMIECIVYGKLVTLFVHARQGRSNEQSYERSVGSDKENRRGKHMKR
ncbi:MAG: hypothetical protein IKF78_06950 [Atopobiaceae bacterium]|nr:hypothetical protein [Atopobiaceae bacterium]